MVTIKWCKKQNKGIRIQEPNERIAKSYLQMAEESIEENSKVTSNIWQASTTYYICYYSLYAFLQRIGIKCEIHQCSIQIMKEFLKEQFNKEDTELLEETFKIRNELQYYANTNIPKNKIKETSIKAKEFFTKTKKIINTITDTEITTIINQLKTPN